jgi:hypothetical protein
MVNLFPYMVEPQSAWPGRQFPDVLEKHLNFSFYSILAVFLDDKQSLNNIEQILKIL